MNVVNDVDFEVDCNGFRELTEEDFLPPEDDRMIRSGVCDVFGGDCFADYAEYFWDEYENHLFDCNN